MTYTLLHNDAIAALRELPDNSVDAVVTDPPYDLVSINKRFSSPDAAPAQYGRDGAFSRLSKGFMGKEWDGTGIAFKVETWAEVMRVLKPGGHLLAFGGTRTYHRMACAIEDAGFEIRDSIHWIYGSGFPKSHSMRDIGRPELGTALKPAHEPIVMARKPIAAPNVASNVLAWGTGALNVDACRTAVDPGGADDARLGGKGVWNIKRQPDGHTVSLPPAIMGSSPAGRWPPNLVLSHAEGCQRVGVRRVKGGSGWSKTGSKASANRAMSGPNYDREAKPDLFADVDGLEAVEEWRCVDGGSFTSYAYAHRHGASSPLGEPSYLLDRLQSLLQDLRAHSTSGNSLLQSASAFYHSERTRSADWTVGYEVARVLGLSELPGFQSGYQTCRDFCDAHVRAILAACQDGPPSLIDVLDRVHSDLTQLVYSHQHQSNGLPSSSDDVLECGIEPSTHASRTDDGREPFSLLAQAGRIGDMAQSEPQQNGQHESTHSSSTFGSDSHGIPSRNADISAAVRLLCLLSNDLAWRFILPAHIIQRNEIVINLPSCPVQVLGQQSGERDSGGPAKRPSGHYLNTADGGGYQGLRTEQRPIQSYQDTGTAARFFPTFTPDYDAPFLYQSKASRRERNAGLGHLPEKEVHRYGSGIGRDDTPTSDPNRPAFDRNTHPTVKPIALCRWLVRLITPPNGTVLDCFMGSGSTGVAAVLEGFNFIGIEREQEYIDIAQARIAHADGGVLEIERTVTRRVTVEETERTVVRVKARDLQLALWEDA